MSVYLAYPLAALCEIGGCFAFWAWWRLDRSALWLWAVEGRIPDRWDALGGMVVLAGSGIILFGSRG